MFHRKKKLLPQYSTFNGPDRSLLASRSCTPGGVQPHHEEPSCARVWRGDRGDVHLRRHRWWRQALLWGVRGRHCTVLYCTRLQFTIYSVDSTVANVEFTVYGLQYTLYKCTIEWRVYRWWWHPSSLLSFPSLTSVTWGWSLRWQVYRTVGLVRLSAF